MRIPMPWTTVYADSTTERKLLATPWYEGCGDVLNCRGTFQFADDIDPIEVGIGVECVNVEDDTPTSATVLARVANAGTQYGTSYTSVNATTQGKRLFRFVWLTARTSTTGVVLGSGRGLRRHRNEEQLMAASIRVASAIGVTAESLGLNVGGHRGGGGPTTAMAAPVDIGGISIAWSDRVYAWNVSGDEGDQSYGVLWKYYGLVAR
jgi:hypothetical protein